VAVSAVQRKKYFEARSAGFSVVQSAGKARFSPATAARIEKAAKALSVRDDLDTSARNYRELKKESTLSGPKAYDDLCPEAKRALEDFPYFRRRYFGRVDTPWQAEGGEELVRLLESDQKEYVVMNMPPSSGKTTLLHDLTCWIICRNRGIRILTGSATMSLAKRNLMRVRRSLERVTIEPGNEILIARGQASEPESTLALDYGRFKPLDKEMWTTEAFIVMQHEEMGGISEKEPTLSAYGMDSGFIGGRFDGCFWDDLVDPRKVRSAEMREAMEDWWQDVAETRLEPAGMLALIGQRLAPDDLYRFSLDMRQPLEDEAEDYFDELSEEEKNELRHDKKYKHLCYMAHYEDRCSEGSHKRNAKPYPEGCLLDPRRISWRDISNLMSNRGERFSVVYQQQDIALDDVLVQKEWVYGTGGSPGCIDKDRDRWEIPRNSRGELLNANDCIVVATADPSPTQYWSVQCLAEGTGVTTRRGEVPIQNVKLSDEVMTRKGWRPVQHITDMGTKETLNIELSNGRTLRATSDHRVWADGEWTRADELLVGSILLSPSISGESGTGATKSLAASFIKIVTGVWVAAGTVCFGPSFDVGSRPPCVDTPGNGGEVFRVNAPGIVAGVVNGEPRSDWSNKESVGKTVGETFAKATAAASVPPVVGTLVPEPTPLEDSGSFREEALVNDYFSGSSDSSVSAYDADPPGFGLDGVSAFTFVHVVSITHGSTTVTFDIGVYGEHEFVAEGVIVHNCWLYHPDSGTRYLIDLFRGKMEAPQFLEYNQASGAFQGLMEEWQALSIKLGFPIQVWVVEQNAAQRFILQYEHFKRWREFRNVEVIPHSTTNNKTDEEYGVTSIKQYWKSGSVRLMGKGEGKVRSMRLIKEVTEYPHGRTDDCVMAEWFFEWNLPNIYLPQNKSVAPWRPKWVRRTQFNYMR
jgi:hypothetical protein